MQGKFKILDAEIITDSKIFKERYFKTFNSLWYNPLIALFEI